MFILAHFLEIDEIFKSLLGIIQTPFSKLPHNNYNNILIWSKNSTNWYGNIFWIHNLATKKSNSFSKVGACIGQKRIRLAHSFQ